MLTVQEIGTLAKMTQEAIIKNEQNRKFARTMRQVERFRKAHGDEFVVYARRACQN